MKGKYFWLTGLVAILTIVMTFHRSVEAQLPFLPEFSGDPSVFLNQSSNKVASGCVRFDGRCIIEIAASPSGLSDRISEVEQRLNDIAPYYIHQESAEVEVRQKKAGQLIDLYVVVEQRQNRLLTVTSQDAGLRAMSIEERADEMSRAIVEGLQTAKQERTRSFIITQVQKGAIAIFVVIGLTMALYYLERQSREQKAALHAAVNNNSQAISTQITQNQRQQLAEIKHRGLQIARFGLWFSGILYLVGLFPYTRFLQVWMINVFRIPFRLLVVGLGVYFLTRFSFVLIDKFTAVLANNYLLTPEANLRLQLRISTISSVTKSVVIITWTVVGILVGLSVVGVNIAPLLAGAGLIGVAISLASQNLIRDAINGFFIILEDQYAVGDVVGVGDATGVVEAINLRITQLRDTEGRLITVPNSEIRMVTNYTSNWSQVDLKIPIAYHSDVEKAISIIEDISNSMMRDRDWQQNILEKPALLGVDEFSSQGVIIRVWIKTKPLQQWPIAREYRRRLKIACDKAGIDLALPHQQIWVSSQDQTES
jgi:small conductance mechanosensitive channel